MREEYVASRKCLGTSSEDPDAEKADIAGTSQVLDIWQGCGVYDPWIDLFRKVHEAVDSLEDSRPRVKEAEGS